MIERSELQEAVAKAFPADALRPERDAGWRLATEMGWLMTPIAEEAGGLGLSPDTVAAIHYEHGKVLGTVPLVAALPVAAAIGADPTWAERLIGGEFVSTSLMFDRLRAADQAPCTLTAVPDADMASHVLAFTGDAALLVPLDADGVTVSERALWDESRRLFDVTVTVAAIAAGEVLARGDDARAMEARLRRDVAIAVAADSLGAAHVTLELTVDYLQARNQFGRPLAMFQALKHRCADLKVKLAGAEALFWSRVADTDSDASTVGLVKAHASEAFQTVTEEAMQMYGGIGLTDEHLVHRFLKRAMLNLTLGGENRRLFRAAADAALVR